MSNPPVSTRRAPAVIATIAAGAFVLAALLSGATPAMAAQNEPGPAVVRISGEVQLIHDDWSKSQKESSSDLRCDDDKVMVGRSHWGDENAKTWIKCAGVIVSGELVETSGAFWSNGIKESAGTTFKCPDDMAMTGRTHRGDENGTTTYRCSYLDISSGRLVLDVVGWNFSQPESAHEYTCSELGVLTGREHKGDENGRTWYRCSTIHA